MCGKHQYEMDKKYKALRTMLQAFLDWSLSFFSQPGTSLPFKEQGWICYGPPQSFLFLRDSFLYAFLWQFLESLFPSHSWFQDSSIQLQICYALSLHKNDTDAQTQQILYFVTQGLWTSSSIIQAMMQQNQPLIYGSLPFLSFLLNNFCVTFFISFALS